MFVKTPHAVIFCGLTDRCAPDLVVMGIRSQILNTRILKNMFSLLNYHKTR